MIIDEIDRLFFEHIRLAAVAFGNLPDVTTFTDAVAYDEARKELGDSLIDIFGVGSSEGRDGKKVNRILIDRCDITDGKIGAWGAKDYERINDSSVVYRKVRYPDMTSDVEYEIRTISKGVTFDRVMLNILTRALGQMRYRPTIDSDGSFQNTMLLIKNMGQRNVTTVDWIERLCKYVAKDCWLQNFEVIEEEIVPLTTVNFSLYLKKSSVTLPGERSGEHVEDAVGELFIPEP